MEVKSAKEKFQCPQCVYHPAAGGEVRGFVLCRVVFCKGIDSIADRTGLIGRFMRSLLPLLYKREVMSEMFMIKRGKLKGIVLELLRPVKQGHGMG